MGHLNMHVRSVDQSSGALCLLKGGVSACLKNYLIQK